MNFKSAYKEAIILRKQTLIYYNYSLGYALEK